MTRLDTTVPTGVFNRVRVGATEDRVVTAGDAVVARVLPAEIPAANRSGALIGDFD